MLGASTFKRGIRSVMPFLGLGVTRIVAYRFISHLGVISYHIALYVYSYGI